MPSVCPTEAEIEHIARGMIARTLPKAEWTHAAHWAAALWLLRHAPDLATPAAMGAAIRAYNLSLGGENTDTAGYHETITIASLRAASAHLARYPAGTGLAAVLADLLASHLGHPEWPLAYWRRGSLFCVAARRRWVEPDLANLPF
jgi:hypothetical protein